jgi:hypothetical protein
MGIIGIINDVLETSAAEAAAVPRGRLLSGSPGQMGAYMAREKERWVPTIKAADITAK